MRIRAAIAVTRTGLSAGLAVIVIVRNGSKKGWRRVANRFCSNSIRWSRGRRPRLSIVLRR